MAKRIEHIDSIRAIAVLLMVMVHAAATWGPSSTTQPSVLVYVVSGLGGLAAPLFVTVFGWGCVQGTSTQRQRTMRATFFIVAQGAINASSPHLFEFWTPGVLTLFGLLTLTQPVWLKGLKCEKIPTFHLAALVSFSTILLVPELQGQSVWASRIGTPSIQQWFEHALLTGTYPLFPWFMYTMFGAWIAISDGKPGMFPTSKASLSMLIGAFFCTAFTLGYSVNNGLQWASPTGDALLTFFPANVPFLIASMLGVSLIWLILERVPLPQLSLLGQRSLTIYLAHFIPIGLFYSLDETYGFSLAASMAFVIAYTVVWWPAAHAWDRLAPRMNVEQLFRAMSKD